MATPDEFLQIDTPENVVFGYEVVGIGSRFLAALVDTTIIVLIQLPVNLLTFYAFFSEGAAGSAAAAVLTFISFALLWGYYIFFEARWNGRTPGKKQVGLRVIRQDGSPVTLSEVLVRNLVRLVDFLPVAYGVGMVAMFIDGRARRLGDLAAGTLVVREQEEVTLHSLRRPSSPAYPLGERGEMETAVADWPLHLLDESDVQLAESFLRRRRALTGNHRRELATQIANRLRAEMALPALPASGQAGAEIGAVVREYRRRSGRREE